MIAPGGGERHRRPPRTYRKDARSGPRRRAAGENRGDALAAAGDPPTQRRGAPRWAERAGDWLVPKIQRLALVGFLVYAAGVFVAGIHADWKYTERRGLGSVRTVPEERIWAEAILWPLPVTFWLFDIALETLWESPGAAGQPPQESTGTRSSVDPNG